jgi:hypothetical protein
MKLRLYRDSVRFRLSQGDVTNLLRTGRLTETTTFGAGIQLSYSLRLVSGDAAIRAVFVGNDICVELSRSEAMEWGEGEAVGMNHLQDLGWGKRLEILIEKDFECLEEAMNGAGEELYPNPKKVCP